MMESNNITDMFPPIGRYDAKSREAYCQRRWNVTPDNDWTPMQFWGDKLESSSNIAFVSGLYDPLHRGSPLTSLSDSVIALVVEDGAHHYDLRANNPADTESVKNVRQKEIEQITKWIAQARKNF
jgi:hypothetical protein